MPETTITIDRDQRDGLYELVRNHLASIEDFWVALERTRDFEAAERLGLEFAEDFALLGDIGWSGRDARESYRLKMPPLELVELLNRLQAEAAHVLVGSSAEARTRREEAETACRFRMGYAVCNNCSPILILGGVPQMSKFDERRMEIDRFALKFGENLLRCRRLADLSQEALAVRASLHRTEIGLLENDQRVGRRRSR